MKHTVKVRSSVRKITPEVAKKWLEKCNGEFQRPLSLSTVETLSRAMKDGQWANNGETVIFSDTGKLLDGQHRLSAVVLSGVTIEATVSTGVLEKDFVTIDSGRVRTMSDILKIRGENDYSDLAASLRRVYNYEYTKGASTEQTDCPPTKLDLEKILNKHPKIRDSVKFARANKSALVAPSMIAPAHYIFSQFDKKLADEFVVSFGSGENLTKASPIYKLRERFIGARRDKEGQLRPRACLYLIFRVFKAMLDTKRGDGMATTQMERLLLPTGHNPNLVLPDLTADKVLTAPKGKYTRPKARRETVKV